MFVSLRLLLQTAAGRVVRFSSRCRSSSSRKSALQAAGEEEAFAAVGVRSTSWRVCDRSVAASPRLMRARTAAPTFLLTAPSHSSITSTHCNCHGLWNLSGREERKLPVSQADKSIRLHLLQLL